MSFGYWHRCLFSSSEEREVCAILEKNAISEGEADLSHLHSFLRAGIITFEVQERGVKVNEVKML